MENGIGLGISSMTSKFDSLWRLMINHKIETEGDVPTVVLCAICSKLMIEPYAAECGCTFCGPCIKNYLKDGRKKCPVGNTECGEEDLKIDENVFKDVRMSHNIKKVIVKCPSERCTFRTELENIEVHIKKCSNMSPKCPFDLLGCGDCETVNDGIGDRICSHFNAHSQILLDLINISRKDVDELKQMMKLKDIEIRELKEDIMGYKREINDIHEFVRQEMKNKNDIVRKEVAINSSFSTSSPSDVEGQNELKDEENKNGKINSDGIKDVKSESCTLAQNEVPATDLTTSKVSHPAFIWEINNFSRRLNEERSQQLYHSETFYRHNYKYCLCCRITELSVLKDNLYLELYFIIMKGDHDESVQWPMSHTVELSIINQSSMMAHKVGRYSHGTSKGRTHCFNKPITTKNDCIGGLSMSVKTIKSTPGIFVNDTVVVNCDITDSFS